jgi:hypothetical protein
LHGSDRSSLFAHPHLLRTTGVRAQDFAGGPQVVVDPGVDMALNLNRVADKEAAIHVIRYDYDEQRDQVPVLPRMQLDVRLSRPFRSAKALSPLGEVGCRLTFSRERREMHRIELEDVPLYFIVLMQ